MRRLRTQRSFRRKLQLGSGGNVGLRQIQREDASAAHRTLQANLAAQQTRQFAADGKAQAGAAVPSAGGSIGLLEGFKDDALLFLCDADAGVGDGQSDYVLGAVQDGMSGTP